MTTTQPPSVTFRVAHFVSVDCGQRVQNFCFRLCASHGAARGTRFRPTISGQDGLTSLDRLAAIHLFLVPHFLLLFLLLLSLYLFSATGDVTAMCFLTFTFVTCRDIIFFLSKLHLFCLSLLSSRPCEDQRLPLDATNARTYRHFTENHLKFSPLAKTEKGKQTGAIIVLLTSQSARAVPRKCLHSMRCAFENRNALLRSGISADRLAPRRTENYRELRKNCTRRKRHHELATARRTSNFDNDYRLRREYRIVILDRRLSSGRPFYRYPLPSPKGIPYRHPRSEVIIRSPLSSREVIIELFPFSLLTPFVRGRSSPLSFLSYRSFLKFTKLFEFSEAAEDFRSCRSFRIYRVAEVF
jgi:hypothetical protein